MKSDPRRTVFIDRLSRFSKQDVQRIVDNIDSVCFDTWNYEEATEKFCPLAVALGLNTLPRPTNDKVGELIAHAGFSPVNGLKGVPGKFYTDRRREDLLEVCAELLT